MLTIVVEAMPAARQYSTHTVCGSNDASSDVTISSSEEVSSQLWMSARQGRDWRYEISEVSSGPPFPVSAPLGRPATAKPDMTL